MCSMCAHVPLFANTCTDVCFYSFCSVPVGVLFNMELIK